MSDKRTIEEKVSLFRSRFIGRDDVYNIDKTNYSEVPADPNVKVKKKQFLNMDKNKEWLAITDKDIANHITGKAPIALFPKKTDDTIRFAIVDFDYPWDYEDVMLTQRFCNDECDIPCYIAKSSRKGWHLIFFFSHWTDMKLFTTFWNHVVSHTHIKQKVDSEEMSSDGKYFLWPEVFPRPSSYGDGVDPTSLQCGAIKPPMVESRMKHEFNAFHLHGSQYPVCVSPVESQWDYLENTLAMDPLWFDNKVRKDLELFVVVPHNRNHQRVKRKVDDVTGDELDEDKNKVLRGDFKKVLNGCPALREAWEMDGPPNYFQRKALGIIASNCKNGLEEVMNHCDESEYWDRGITKKNMNSFGTRYRPLTCKRLQETGVCVKNIHPTGKDASSGEVCKDNCLMSRKDKETKEPIDPSPYRFARMRTKKEDVSLARLRTEINDVNEKVSGIAAKSKKAGDPEYDRAVKDFYDSVVDTMLRSEHLESTSEKESFRDFVAATPWLTKTKMKDLNKEIKSRRRIETEKKWTGDNGYLKYQDTVFKIKNNGYVMVSLTDDGDEKENFLTNFVVKFEQEKTRVKNLEKSKDGDDPSKTYTGYILMDDGNRYTFRDLPVTDFEAPRLRPFFERLSNLIGIGISYNDRFTNQIRNCIMQFNRGDMRDYVTVSMIDEVGWNGKSYISSNVFINKDGIFSCKDHPIKAGSESRVSLNKNKWSHLAIRPEAGGTKAPSFAILEEDGDGSSVGFREILNHFLKDFMQWHQPEITYVGAGFTFAAAIQKFFPLEISDKSPTLFYVGLFGGGKSEVVTALQNFYGPYRKALGWDSTTRNLVDNAHIFKDMVIAIDDYKKSIMPEVKVIKMIQNIYDRQPRGAQTITGQARSSDAAQGLFVMSGEDLFDSEPSATSRCLVVSFNKYRKGANENRSSYSKVIARRKYYSAITARLIHYSLSLPKKFWDEVYQESLNNFGSRTEGMSDNTDRIINNISMAYIGFRVFMEMCFQWYQVIDEKDFQRYMLEMRSACINIIDDTVSKLREDKSGATYLRDLVELITSKPNEFYIEGIGSTPMGYNATRLGWRDTKDPDVVYLLKNTAFNEIIKKQSGSKQVRQTINTIAQTLFEDGDIVKFTPSVKPCFLARYEDKNKGTKTQNRVLALKYSSLFSGEDEASHDVLPSIPLPSEASKPKSSVINYAPTNDRPLEI